MSQDLLNVSGGCYCGAVRFRAEGVRPEVTECHCSQCRKQSGHRYATTSVGAGGMTIETGADKITWFQASPNAERGFCSVCGSTMFWKPASEDRWSILAAMLDEPNGLKLTKHIFVADKGSYYEIDDGLPQYRATV